MAPDQQDESIPIPGRFDGWLAEREGYALLVSRGATLHAEDPRNDECFFCYVLHRDPQPSSHHKRPVRWALLPVLEVDGTPSRYASIADAVNDGAAYAELYLYDRISPI